MIFVGCRCRGVRRRCSWSRLLLMAVARRLPHSRIRRAARDRQHPPARRADADHRAVAGPRPRAARHRDPDRRQPAAAVQGGAAGQARRRSTSSTSSRPMPTASTPSCAQRAPQAKLERVPMLRGRIVSANGIKAEDIKVPAERRLGAAERPRHHLSRARCRAGSRSSTGEWWSADYQGPPLVSIEKQDRRRARPQGRRPDHRQRARPQHQAPHRQPAQRRLAKPRHQFRAGVLAGHVRRRAAHRTSRR